MAYSIWIIPTEPVFSKLQQTVNELAVKYHSPTFTPHLTLISGGIDQELPEIQKIIQGAVMQVKQLTLSLDSVSFSTTYYQSVFVRVTSTAQLMQLNLDLKKLLNLPNDVFMPHISLIYGDYDMATREKVASGVKLRNLSFIANEVTIIPVKPKPKQWKPVATIPFGRNE